MTIQELLQALVNIETILRSTLFSTDRYKRLTVLQAELNAQLDEALIAAQTPTTVTPTTLRIRKGK